MSTPEDFLKWRKTLNEQIKNNRFAGNYKMVTNLAQAILGGLSLDAFVNKRRAQEVKKKIRLVKGTTELTAHQIYDYAIFKLSISASYTQSGWRETCERQRKYMRRDLFMGKLNPEKFSQRLQEMKRYLDFIPMEKNTGKDKTPIMKAYGKVFPDDEIRSVMGRAVPWEWKVNLLALGKALEIQRLE
jgi:hypothetical protein